MTPERYAKLLGHHKAGAYAVATLADVDGLRAELAAERASHEETRAKLAELQARLEPAAEQTR